MSIRLTPIILLLFLGLLSAFVGVSGCQSSASSTDSKPTAEQVQEHAKVRAAQRLKKQQEN